MNLDNIERASDLFGKLKSLKEASQALNQTMSPVITVKSSYAKGATTVDICDPVIAVALKAQIEERIHDIEEEIKDL